MRWGHRGYGQVRLEGTLGGHPVHPLASHKIPEQNTMSEPPSPSQIPPLACTPFHCQQTPKGVRFHAQCPHCSRGSRVLLNGK